MAVVVGVADRAVIFEAVAVADRGLPTVKESPLSGLDPAGRSRRHGAHVAGVDHEVGQRLVGVLPVEDGPIHPLRVATQSRCRYRTPSSLLSGPVQVLTDDTRHISTGADRAEMEPSVSGCCRSLPGVEVRHQRGAVLGGRHQRDNIA